MAFIKDPSLVWKFYIFRREMVLEKNQMRFVQNNNTQNVDGLHLKAYSKNLLQMHGNILETKCTKCKVIEYNTEK